MSRTTRITPRPVIKVAVMRTRISPGPGSSAAAPHARNGTNADAQTAHGSRTSQRRNAFKREFMMFNDHLVAKGSPG